MKTDKIEKNIILIGMPGSGKSTVGVLLAKWMGMDFIDTDILIQKASGQMLYQMIEEKGIEAFIKAEEDILKSIQCRHSIVATGGSAVIMRKMGEGRSREAREDFTALILVNVAAGLVMCSLGYLLMGRVFAGMNLSAEVEGYCRAYLSCYLPFTVPILLMNNFTLYMIASGKASLSLVCSVT